MCELKKWQLAVAIMVLLFISQYYGKMFLNIWKTFIGEGW